MPNGKGKLYLENGDTYEGDFVEDKCEGFGCLTSSTKTYIGSWQNDLYHGEGQENMQDGSWYQGQFS